jgi:hypothetical protein
MVQKTQLPFDADGHLPSADGYSVDFQLTANVNTGA